MALSPGSRLGPYEIRDALGAGGMGEVYRGRDTRLNRDVAIKILPELFAVDAERLARFTREAQTLAALNHPNIAQIYGFEDTGAVRALAMELVAGDDLSAVIGRGPVPIPEALAIARQMADALEAAHELGIIHRDFKPANVKLRDDGTVKVLDFGLAKAMDPAGTLGGEATTSPTLTARATQHGVIIGTAAYMAPEQARGKVVDRRADIWAFGVVLFEMLTGTRAFDGSSISDVLASVLKSDPDWSLLPVDLPPSVHRLLRRCLEKDPRKRLSAMGDARLELDDAERGVTLQARTPDRSTHPIRAWMIPAVAGALVTAAMAALLWPRTAVEGQAAATRLSVLAPPGQQFYPESANIAVSPDGTMVAFVVSSPTLSETQLWVRSLDTMTARRLDGGDGAALPFWSPDSRRIGFFTIGKLKTISVSGGRAETLCDATDGRGGAWNSSNVIVFAPAPGGPLYRIPAAGGTPTPVTELDSAGTEFGHRFPSFLPDGDRFLYTALPGKGGQFEVFAGSLGDRSRTPIASFGSAPVYAEPGWLLYSRQGTLAAQRFDAQTLRLQGEPVLLPDQPTPILNPATAMTAGRAVSASLTGALAYYSAPDANTVASWYDMSGRHIGTLPLPSGFYESADISPDGQHAVLVRPTSPTESSLWLANLARGGASPLSFSPGRNDSPVWSPDGTRVVFASDRDGPQNLYVKRVGDVSPEQPLYRSPAPFKRPSAWSPDGQFVIVTQLDADTAQNVWRIPVSAEGEAKLLVRGAGRDVGGPVSPDGRWLAYWSDDSGRYELSVQSFPEPGRRLQVSTESSFRAWWSRDGREMLFVDERMERLWRVGLDLVATLRIATPRQIATLPAGITWIDATPAGDRLLALAPERAAAGAITIVQNWWSEAR